MDGGRGEVVETKEKYVVTRKQESRRDVEEPKEKKIKLEAEADYKHIEGQRRGKGVEEEGRRFAWAAAPPTMHAFHPGRAPDLQFGMLRVFFRGFGEAGGHRRV